MKPPDDITLFVLTSLATLSEAELDAMQLAVSRAIKPMSIYRVLELRQRILTAFDPNSAGVRGILDLINGQIVLREIAGDSGWR